MPVASGHSTGSGVMEHRPSRTGSGITQKIRNSIISPINRTERGCSTYILTDTRAATEILNSCLARRNSGIPPNVVSQW